MKRVSSSNIISLAPNEVFVFGSNLAGIHGAGAAKKALAFGAKLGVGIGPAGNTYAIPTKDKDINTLPLSDIQGYVDQFIEYAADLDMISFLVTPIGCGLAGYSARDIAPMFKKCLEMENVYLPESFIKTLSNYGKI